MYKLIMDIKLTNRQEELIKVAKVKGFLTFDDFNAAFSSPISRKANLERLIALKILKHTTVVGKFELNRELVKDE